MASATLPAALLHASLLCDGFRLSVDAGRLLVSPASRLAASQRAEIVSHRDELVALVGEAAGLTELDAQILRIGTPAGRRASGVAVWV